MAYEAARLQTLRYEAALDDSIPGDRRAATPRSFRGLGDVAAGDDDAESFTSDEAAARFYLDQLLVSDDRPTMRSIARPDRPERVPDLVFEAERDLRATHTRQVRFSQAHRQIPIFGARAVVELAPDRSLVALDGRLDEVIDVSPVEDLTNRDALHSVAEFVGTGLDDELAAGARLNFFKSTEKGGRWHLVWVLDDVLAAPPEPEDRDLPATVGHALGPRPPAPHTYLVDAHGGEVVYWFSRVPSMAEVAKGRGRDEDDIQHDFWCLANGSFALDDRLRHLETYDLGFADLATNPPHPTATIANTAPDFASSNRAGVTAHVNAGRVQDFYKSVLQRDGIDDKGMTLVSLVNCCASDMQPPAPPELLNAFWWNGKMWYGQVKDGDRLVSLARHLDVIGHELTHGVVEYTAGLHYRGESGALNESFADVLGVIIRNWYLAPDRDDPSTWNWEIGTGLQGGGKPFRDLSDPARCNQPAHVADQYRGVGDHGGVHINSGIPNKAAHLLLTASDSSGQRVFSVQDVAVILYLALTKLNETAQFTDLRAAVVQTARVYFQGLPEVRAVEQAYDSVGIA